MLDWSNTPVANDVPTLWARLIRLIASIPDRVVLKTHPDGSNIVVPAGSIGVLVTHGVRGRVPRAAHAWSVGNTPSTAVLTTGLIDTKYVHIYSTVQTTVHVEVLI